MARIMEEIYELADEFTSEGGDPKKLAVEVRGVFNKRAAEVNKSAVAEQIAVLMSYYGYDTTKDILDGILEDTGPEIDTLENIN